MNIIRLTGSEWVIMKILWKNSRCSNSTILTEADKCNISWTKSTLNVLLKRLIGKNAIEKDKTVTPYEYFALISKEECSIAELKILLNQVFDNSMLELCSTAMNSNLITFEEQRSVSKIFNRSVTLESYRIKDIEKRREYYIKRKNKIKKVEKQE